MFWEVSFWRGTLCICRGNSSALWDGSGAVHLGDSRGAPPCLPAMSLGKEVGCLWRIPFPLSPPPFSFCASLHTRKSDEESTQKDLGFDRDGSLNGKGPVRWVKHQHQMRWGSPGSCRNTRYWEQGRSKVGLQEAVCSHSH